VEKATGDVEVQTTIGIVPVGIESLVMIENLRMAKQKKTDDKLTPFSFVNEINYGKRDLMRDQNGEHSDLLERVYNPYITNRSLSYFHDTVIHANEMNKNHHLDSRLQNMYLINTIRKRKRFSKWIKPTELEDIEAVKEYYGYSNEKARQVLALLTNERLTELKQRVYKGGYNKSNKTRRGSGR